MGNSFVLYSGNNHFEITTESSLYAFAIVGLTAQITTTPFGNWEASAEGTSDSKYNYIFRYKPGDVRTAEQYTDKFVFTLDSGTIPSGAEVHWVNGTTASYDGDENSSTPFSAVLYNIEFSSSDAGSGGGDPYIYPIYNPSNRSFKIPTSNSIYKYFDNLDETRRIVINAQMWIIDGFFLHIVNGLKGMNSPYYDTAKLQLSKFQKETSTLMDMSFMRHMSFRVNDECIILDMETLEYVLGDTTKELTNIIITPIENIQENAGEGILANSFARTIYISSNKHGMITIYIGCVPENPNYRNFIKFKVSQPGRLNPFNCCGALIRIDQIETVPSILHVNSKLTISLNDLKMVTAKVSKRQHSEILRRERRKFKHCGKPGQDLHSLICGDPEKYYLKYISDLSEK
jgi:hypothetical protein